VEPRGSRPDGPVKADLKGAAELQLFEVLQALFMISYQRGDAEHDAFRLGLVFCKQVYYLLCAKLHLRDEFKITRNSV